MANSLLMTRFLPSKNRLRPVIKTSLGFYSVLIVLASVIFFIQEENSHQMLFISDVQQLLLVFVSGFGAAIVVVFLCRLLEQHVVWASHLIHDLRNVLGDLNRKETIYLAIASGLAEELLFRGVLQPAVGIWLASAIFSCVHIGPNRSWNVWPVMAFFAGLLFGFLFQWTGALVTPIIAHVTINYLNMRSFAKNTPRHFQPLEGF